MKYLSTTNAWNGGKMEIVRNSVIISGLTDEKSLFEQIKGQIIQFSETSTIFVPDKEPEISNLIQIFIKLELLQTNLITTPAGKTINLNGFLKLKLNYLNKNDSENSQKICTFDIACPYHSYIQLMANVDMKQMQIYILDAYFNLIDSRKIFCDILYLVSFPSKDSEKLLSTTSLSTQLTDSFQNKNNERHIKEPIYLKKSLIDFDSEYL